MRCHLLPSLMMGICFVAKVMAVGPVPLNFDSLRAMHPDRASVIFHNWLRQMTPTQADLLPHIPPHNHDFLYGQDSTGRVWFGWPLRNHGFSMENWSNKHRAYLVNNNRDVFVANSEAFERDIDLETYLMATHKPIGFVLPDYRTLELEGIALSSIDYA